MSLAIRILPEVLRSVPYTAFVGGYIAIGTPLAHPARLIKLYNGTDADMLISWDGVNNHDILPTKAFILLDVCTNKTRDDGLYVGQDTVFWARQAVANPTVGNVYLSVYYGSNASV